MKFLCGKDNPAGSIGDHFVARQFRVRRQAMRLEGGRSSLGMRRKVTRRGGSEKEHT